LFGQYSSVLESPHRVLTGRSLADQIQDIGAFLLLPGTDRTTKEDAA
jgi:hypothetical protein